MGSTIHRQRQVENARRGGLPGPGPDLHPNGIAIRPHSGAHSCPNHSEDVPAQRQSNFYAHSCAIKQAVTSTKQHSDCNSHFCTDSEALA